ncbi:hypothetical protein CBR_g31547 [Chara braunii]|uniref:Integrase catalytic domain-containing protein n=1 Tax=Chara braunii TaxID=69332 RepID=A0A388LFC2_CHABU|nr:hypothetical protein CBR_g31547 [Chara braunii]|eukprot:GBG80991.1 hypothetical protein CBR_g31547 [Chara braunii]
MTNVAFQIGKVHALGDVVVFSVTSYDVLLGLPALNALQANLDFERQVAVLRNIGGNPYTIPMRLTLRTTTARAHGSFIQYRNPQKPWLCHLCHTDKVPTEARFLDATSEGLEKTLRFRRAEVWTDDVLIATVVGNSLREFSKKEWRRASERAEDYRWSERRLEKRKTDGSGIWMVVPYPFVRNDWVRAAHEETATHFAVRITEAAIDKHEWYWSNIQDDVKFIVKNCPVCAADKAPIQPPRSIMPTIVQRPFQRVSMDTTDIVMPPEPNSCEYSILLVFIDHFSKWTEVYPCRTRQTTEIAWYVNRFLEMDQDTEEILTDNKAEFRGEVMRNLVVHGVSIRNTAPHMSQSNGLVEKANRVIKTALRRNIAAKDTRQWPDIVDHILIELTWTRDSEHRAVNEDVELLIIQASRTKVEGDLLGSVFGTVALGHRPTIVGELLIPFTQLLDDLPIDIISHCDENPAPHILARSLMSYLQWSACLEDQWGNGSYPSSAEYLNPGGITDILFFQHRMKLGEEAEEEEEEEEAEEEEEETFEEEENYSEYSEHESGAVSEESEESEEREEEEDGAGAEEGADQAETQEDDPTAGQRRVEIAEGKRPLEQLVEVDLPIPDNPTRDPEPPKEEDELPHAEASGTPAWRRRSRSPSPSPRPPV